VEEITSREEQFQELEKKLQQSETELFSLQQQQQQQSKLHNEQMEHLSKQVEQLQQTVERDCESYELLCYCALEVERQKWEVHEARLTSQLDKAMHR